MAERYVLTAEAWWMRGLRQDPEAEAWLDRASGDGINGTDYRALYGALVDEGVIDLFVFGRQVPTFYAQDDHHIEVLAIRRRYRGPVPPQVLAAFQPEHQMAERVWFFT
jgi:hypothetical protein